MPNTPEPPPLPTDLAAAHAMILAERAARLASEIAVERLKLEVARLLRERFGTSSERSARIDQLEFVLEDLEETLAETQARAAAEPEALSGAASSRRKPARRPLPEHLPRERVVHPGATTCAPARQPAPVAAERAFVTSARTSPRPWSGSRRAGS